MSKNYGADQQRLQISDLHFDNFSYTNNPLLEDMDDSRLRYLLGHNFLRKLCYGSKKWRWLNQWMIQDLRHDPTIASALNKIIHNSHFKRRISLEEQNGPEEELKHQT